MSSLPKNDVAPEGAGAEETRCVSPSAVSPTLFTTTLLFSPTGSPARLVAKCSEAVGAIGMRAEGIARRAENVIHCICSRVSPLQFAVLGFASVQVALLCYVLSLEGGSREEIEGGPLLMELYARFICALLFGMTGFGILTHCSLKLLIQHVSKHVKPVPKSLFDAAALSARQRCAHNGSRSWTSRARQGAGGEGDGDSRTNSCAALLRGFVVRIRELHGSRTRSSVSSDAESSSYATKVYKEADADVEEEPYDEVAKAKTLDAPGDALSRDSSGESNAANRLRLLELLNTAKDDEGGSQSHGSGADKRDAVSKSLALRNGASATTDDVNSSPATCNNAHHLSRRRLADWLRRLSSKEEHAAIGFFVVSVIEFSIVFSVQDQGSSYHEHGKINFVLFLLVTCTALGLILPITLQPTWKRKLAVFLVYILVVVIHCAVTLPHYIELWPRGVGVNLEFERPSSCSVRETWPWITAVPLRMNFLFSGTQCESEGGYTSGDLSWRGSLVVETWSRDADTTVPASADGFLRLRLRARTPHWATHSASALQADQDAERLSLELLGNSTATASTSLSLDRNYTALVHGLTQSFNELNTGSQTTNSTTTGDQNKARAEVDTKIATLRSLLTTDVIEFTRRATALQDLFLQQFFSKCEVRMVRTRGSFEVEEDVIQKGWEEEKFVTIDPGAANRKELEQNSEHNPRGVETKLLPLLLRRAMIRVLGERHLLEAAASAGLLESDAFVEVVKGEDTDDHQADFPTFGDEEKQLTRLGSDLSKLSRDDGSSSPSTHSNSTLTVLDAARKTSLAELARLLRSVGFARLMIRNMRKLLHGGETGKQRIREISIVLPAFRSAVFGKATCIAPPGFSGTTESAFITQSLLLEPETHEQVADVKCNVTNITHTGRRGGVGCDGVVGVKNSTITTTTSSVEQEPLTELETMLSWRFAALDFQNRWSRREASSKPYDHIPIVMIVIDAIGRAEAMRKLPETFAQLKAMENRTLQQRGERSNYTLFDFVRHHSTGFATYQNVIGMLYGSPHDSHNTCPIFWRHSPGPKFVSPQMNETDWTRKRQDVFAQRRIIPDDNRHNDADDSSTSTSTDSDGRAPGPVSTSLSVSSWTPLRRYGSAAEKFPAWMMDDWGPNVHEMLAPWVEPELWDPDNPFDILNGGPYSATIRCLGGRFSHDYQLDSAAPRMVRSSSRNHVRDRRSGEESGASSSLCCDTSPSANTVVRPAVSLHWFLEAHEATRAVVETVDRGLARFLRRIEPSLDDTILIIASDHGNHLGAYPFLFDNGYVEMSNSMFLLSAPNWLLDTAPVETASSSSYGVDADERKSQLQTIRDALERSQQELTTHYDIYETLVDLVKLDAKAGRKKMEECNKMLRNTSNTHDHNGDPDSSSTQIHSNDVPPFVLPTEQRCSKHGRSLLRAIVGAQGDRSTSLEQNRKSMFLPEVLRKTCMCEQCELFEV
ncbi:unnamed protein product [Amoebophrya sp. A25]|nr:unnamed protein product [Amoebophrya sp. A25]|eukprot:GSA25T00018668001.1